MMRAMDAEEKSRTQFPRRRRAAFILAAFALGSAFALVVLEVGARAIEARKQRPTESLDLLVANPVATGSYRLRPNLDLTTELGGRAIRITTNRHGMPWRDVAVEKGDRLRLALLGDSFAFGCWADDYRHGLVGVFDESVSDERWEVLNFAVGGYGPADMELLLHERVMDFSPTYVIVVIFTGNDFRDTYLGIDRYRIKNGTVRLRKRNIRERVPGELLQSNTPDSLPCERESWILRGLDRSAAFRLLSPFLDLENLCVEFAVQQNFTMYTFWSQQPYPEAALAAKGQVLDTLERVNVYLRDHGARLGIAVIPMTEQVHARNAQGVDYDIAFPQAYIQTFAQQRGIPYLDLRPILREHVIRTNERLYWRLDSHLNNRGHAIVGEAVADWFRCCVRNAGLEDSAPR